MVVGEAVVVEEGGFGAAHFRFGKMKDLTVERIAGKWDLVSVG